jgi:PST family polysaccharide transporter
MKNTDSQSFEPAAGKMADRVTSGIMVTGLAQTVRVGTQMGSVIVLSRLLSPLDFGLVAMASPFFGLVALFQDLGLGQAIVQKKLINHEEINALFFINLCAGLILGSILILISPLAGTFYKDEHVVRLLAAMSIIILIAMIGGQQNAILTRRMQFGRLAILDAVGALSGFAISVAWTLVSKSYWAIYAGMVVSTALPAIGSWVMAGWRPSWPPRIGNVKSLLHFGAGITGFNFFNFIARNLDNALIGRRWGDGPLGLYDRAYKLLLFPLQQVNNPVAKVMIPALARVNDDRDRYAHAFSRALCMVLLLTLPGVAFMTTFAPTLIPFVLGPKWTAATPIFQFLGIAGLIQVINNPTGWLLVSQGRTKLYAAWGIATAITSAIAFVAGLPFGPVGVAGAYAMSEYIRTPILWWLVGRSGPVGVKTLIGAIHPQIVSGVLVLALMYWLHSLTTEWPPIGALMLGAASTYALNLAVIALFPQGRRVIGEVFRLATGIASKLNKHKSKPNRSDI